MNIQQSKQEELETKLSAMLDTSLAEKETLLEELGFVANGDFNYYDESNDDTLDNLDLIAKLCIK